jgi:protein-tyrosine phosphatase
MSAYCDLHNHMLYGLDDGAKTLEDSLEMARAMVDLGYSDVAPSPHARPEYAPAELAIARLEEVQAALDREGIALRLHANAESYFLDDGLLANAGTPRSRTLGTGGYLLVEAPYRSPVPTLTDLLFRLKLKGVTCLIAHPERCAEFDRKGRAAECVGMGARLQLDLAALIGRYGGQAKKLARHWLSEGLYSVAATDTHAPSNLREWVGESIAALRAEVGDRAAELLLGEHPRRVLCGETLDI